MGKHKDYWKEPLYIFLHYPLESSKKNLDLIKETLSSEVKTIKNESSKTRMDLESKIEKQNDKMKVNEEFMKNIQNELESSRNEKLNDLKKVESKIDENLKTQLEKLNVKLQKEMGQVEKSSSSSIEKQNLLIRQCQENMEKFDRKVKTEMEQLQKSLNLNGTEKKLKDLDVFLSALDKEVGKLQGKEELIRKDLEGNAKIPT